MFFLGKNLSDNKPLIGVLKNVFGLNKFLIVQLCRVFGLNPKTNLETLTDKQIMVIEQWLFDQGVKLNQELIRQKKKQLQDLIDVRSYRGVRLRRCLPVRGQRTHTNAKTQKRLGGFFKLRKFKKGKKK